MRLSKPSVALVIPARFASSRFPGKPLARLAGKPLIQHVYEAAVRVPAVTQVVVATDDRRIQEEVRKFGGTAELVEGPCRTGTDRVAVVASSLESDMIVNLQADEILVDSSLLSDLLVPFLSNDASMGTLKRRITHERDISRPGVVKVVTDHLGRALYFSRVPIPHIRDAGSGPGRSPLYYMHLGVYIFRKETLLRLASLPTGQLEEAEQLEQLRALENGIPIQVWETQQRSIRIDTPDELEEAQRLWGQVEPCSSSS